VCLLGRNLNDHTQPEKFKPSRDIKTEVQEISMSPTVTLLFQSKERLEISNAMTASEMP
jgi:hypothetical protein